MWQLVHCHGSQQGKGVNYDDNIGEKALGWMTAFAVMATLAVSASAADQRVLLDGYRAESGTVESDETGQLSLMGSAITKTGTATVFFTSAYGNYTATILLHTPQNLTKHRKQGIAVIQMKIQVPQYTPFPACPSSTCLSTEGKNHATSARNRIPVPAVINFKYFDISVCFMILLLQFQNR